MNKHQTKQMWNMFNALNVIAKDPKISAWLSENDPKALEQVKNAIKATLVIN